MANPFTVQPLGGLQNIQMINQGMQGIAQNVQAERQQEQLAQAQQAVAEAFESGDVNAIRQAMIQYPEMAEQAKSAFGFTNEQTERVARETYRRVLSDPENAPAYMQQGIQQVAEFGGRPSMMMQDLQMLQENPEAALQNIRVGYAALASEEEFGAMFGDQAGPEIGKYNPRDYTADSFAEFVRTRDPSVLERYAAQRSVDIGGVPHVFDPAIGGYRPATVFGGRPSAGGQRGAGSQGGGVQPASAFRQSGTITAEDVAYNRSTIVAAEERAKLDAALAKEGYRLTETGGLEPIPGGEPAQKRQAAEEAKTEQKSQAYQKADVMTNKIDSALNQVDWNSAGAIGQFLQFVGGTDARDLSANLETIQANLGFDALQDMRDASPTGGALGQVTEKEIKFLQSVIESLDQAQSPTQLRSNLQQLRKGVQKTRDMISGDISVVESEEEIANLPDGAEYIVADDPARSVRLKGGAGNIMQMTRQQLEALNPADMTDEQLQQAARRYEQLGAQ